VQEWTGTGDQWTNIAPPGLSFAVDTAGTLFALTPDGNQLWVYNNSPFNWSLVDDSRHYDFLFPAAFGVHACQNQAGGGFNFWWTDSQFRNTRSRPGTWLEIAIDRSDATTGLYGRPLGNNTVERFFPQFGGVWSTASFSPGAQIRSANGGIFSWAPNMQEVWRYDPANDRWNYINGPAADVIAGGNTVMAVGLDDSQVYQYQ
jgi:hypothetical protein